MALIKDIYSPAFYEKFSTSVQAVYPAFDKTAFIGGVFIPAFASMEWKERMKHTTRVFHEFLPGDFAAAVVWIENIIAQLRKDSFADDSLPFVFFPDYIETYGLDSFEHGVRALEVITQFVSCEFAVRPFILKYGNRMIDEMVRWSSHENHKVRRLASEGSRPRLPWAMAIPALKKDPTRTIALLENMKNDPSEWVRRSVANHLNDIAKDHPAVVIEIAGRWRGQTKETDAIVKHGCRTLLKQGHPEILKLYNLASENISQTELKVLNPEVSFGEYLEFSFTVTNNNAIAQTVRLEYAVYYQKASGQLAKKVYKISERIYEAGAQVVVHRKQSFKPITTRKFYAGLHRVAVIVNGMEQEPADFILIGL